MAQSSLIPSDVLVLIAQRNRIQIVLHAYLTHKHNHIFRRKAARNKDYAVVFYHPEQTKAFISSDENFQPPEPSLEFFGEKREARSVLGTNPNSAMAWRHSPKLELMY